MPVSRDWFTYARADLLAASVLLEQDEILFSAVGFHLQQCMEKAIKGYLKLNKVRFSKSPDLRYLLTLVEEKLPELAKELDWVSELADYAVMARYPDAVVEVDLSHDRLTRLLARTKLGHQKILDAISR